MYLDNPDEPAVQNVADLSKYQNLKACLSRQQVRPRGFIHVEIYSRRTIRSKKKYIYLKRLGQKENQTTIASNWERQRPPLEACATCSDRLHVVSLEIVCQTNVCHRTVELARIDCRWLCNRLADLLGHIRSLQLH